MLIEFSVGNFRSFRETQTLSMVAAGNISAPEGLEDNVFSAGLGDLKLLKSCAVYGPNASGKSNLIKAFEFMRSLVLGWPGSFRPAIGDIPIEPFLLNEEAHLEPSFFQVIFVVGGIQYRYGFEVTRQRITTEWLFHVPSTKEAKLFERTLESGITPKAGFKEGKGIEERTRDDALFLTTIAQFNGVISRSLMNWFDELEVVSGISKVGSRNQIIQYFDGEGPVTPEEMTQFVRDLDLGIEDISIETKLTNTGTHAGLFVDRYVRTDHRVYNKKGEASSIYPFNMYHNESTGTQKLFSLAVPVVAALKYGRTLVIDELDSSLHPLITTALIRLFHDKTKNPHNAQLVFATHDTNLLDRSLLRRDQIWFVEKDRQGASHLYSLVEFRVRKEAAFEKDYIQGRYGAIPFLGDFSYLVENGSSGKERETVADAAA